MFAYAIIQTELAADAGAGRDKLTVYTRECTEIINSLLLKQLDENVSFAVKSFLTGKAKEGGRTEKKVSPAGLPKQLHLQKRFPAKV